MSIAELFYAKQAERAQRFPVPRRRKATLGRHPLAPPHRKFVLEPLEPRLLLSSELVHQILPEPATLTGPELARRLDGRDR